MILQKLHALARKSLPAALAEVTLIFIGITLALMFENWNSERIERADERALLQELKANLGENVERLEGMTIALQRSIDRIEIVLDHLENRKPVSESLSTALAAVENWPSPYLTSSAYETLKSRGLDKIRDIGLRAQIIRLFDGRYALLKDDIDRSEWINYETSMLPMVITRVEKLPDSKARPANYEALLNDQEFKLALSRTVALRSANLNFTNVVINETKALMDKL